MKSYIDVANQAMLEGNRDEVLRLLEGDSETDDALWLRAHAAISEEERYNLLQQLSNERVGPLSALAAEIVGREDEFANQLHEPPDYKFWKQPTWEGKLRKLRPFSMWLTGGLFLLFLSLIGISLNTKYQSQQDATVASIKSTQTAAAVFNQTVAVYAAGQLRILQIEHPTNRPVTFGEIENETPVIASPAAGASFTAIHFKFSCSLALCINPPEAEIRLLMMDGKEIGYSDSTRPFLIGQPPSQRIAQSQSTDFWYVFEVPNGSTPDAVLVFTGDNATPQFINWIAP